MISTCYSAVAVQTLFTNRPRDSTELCLNQGGTMRKIWQLLIIIFSLLIREWIQHTFVTAHTVLTATTYFIDRKEMNHRNWCDRLVRSHYSWSIWWCPKAFYLPGWSSEWRRCLKTDASTTTHFRGLRCIHEILLWTYLHRISRTTNTTHPWFPLRLNHNLFFLRFQTIRQQKRVSGW